EATGDALVAADLAEGGALREWRALEDLDPFDPGLRRQGNPDGREDCAEHARGGPKGGWPPDPTTDHQKEQKEPPHPEPHAPPAGRIEPLLRKSRVWTKLRRIGATRLATAPASVDNRAMRRHS